METVIPWSRLKALIEPPSPKRGKVANITMMEDYLYGEEMLALGDRGYHKANRTIDHLEKEVNLMVLTPTRKLTSGEFTKALKALNRMPGCCRPFGQLLNIPSESSKRQFGFVKVCYRGQAKNNGQNVTLFELANLWLAPKRFQSLMGEVHI